MLVVVGYKIAVIFKVKGKIKVTMVVWHRHSIRIKVLHQTIIVTQKLQFCPLPEGVMGP